MGPFWKSFASLLDPFWEADPREQTSRSQAILEAFYHFGMPFRTGFAFHHFMISFGKPIVKNTPLGPESFGDDFHYFGIPFGKPILENTPLGPLQFGEAFHYLVIPFGKPVLENTSLGPEPVQKSFLSLWGPFWRANCRGQASRTRAIWRRFVKSHKDILG